MKERLKKMLIEIEQIKEDHLFLKIYSKIEKTIDILFYAILFPCIVLHELAHYLVYLVARVFRLPLKMTIFYFPKLEEMKNEQIEASLTFEIEMEEKLSFFHRFFVALIALAPGFLLPVFGYLIYQNYNSIFVLYLFLCFYLMIPSYADRFLFRLAFAKDSEWLKLKKGEK